MTRFGALSPHQGAGQEVRLSACLPAIGFIVLGWLPLTYPPGLFVYLLDKTFLSLVLMFLDGSTMCLMTAKKPFSPQADQPGQ